MAPTLTFGLLSLGLSGLCHVASAASSSSSGCNDECYSAIHAYNTGDDPYSGNGICYKWLSGYPPAHTTQTYTQTPYLAYVTTTTYVTRTETVWTLAPGVAAPSSATTTAAASTSPAAASAAGKVKRFRQPKAPLHKRQTTANSAATTSVVGLPLPNSGLATSCNNNPQSFASACSCIGDDAQTYYAYVTSTINATSTAPVEVVECTTTITSDACAASATYGLQSTPLIFGDTNLPDQVFPVVVSNSSTAASCCRECFTCKQNCRYFTYTAPANSTDSLADGGTCALDLEGDSCPQNQLPPNYYGSQYNYLTEGEPDPNGSPDGTLYGFGPCAQQVPRFYYYGRVGAGTCTTTQTVVTASN